MKQLPIPEDAEKKEMWGTGQNDDYENKKHLEFCIWNNLCSKKNAFPMKTKHNGMFSINFIVRNVPLFFFLSFLVFGENIYGATCWLLLCFTGIIAENFWVFPPVDGAFFFF